MTKTATELEKEIHQLKEIIKALIAWIANSDAAPLTGDQAKTLLNLLDK